MSPLHVDSGSNIVLRELLLYDLAYEVYTAIGLRETNGARAKIPVVGGWHAMAGLLF